MTGMMPHPCQPLDHRCHPRQRPQLGAEPVRAGTRPQGAIDLRQLPRVELGFPPRAAGGLQAPHPLRAPRLMPVIDCRRRHAQRPRHGALRLSLGEQACGSQPPPFQRCKIAPRRGGHVSTWHRTLEIY